MRQDLKPNTDEEKLLSFARSYLAEAFPNPERIGCPSSQSLQQLARRPTEADLSITEHLSCCSPCFHEYQGLLASLKNERAEASAKHGIFRLTGISIYLGAAAFLTVAVFCLSLWRSHHQQNVTRMAQTRTVASPNVEAGSVSSYALVLLDMRGSSQLRGARQQKSFTVTMPHSHLRISVYLPMGSDAGTYHVSLTKSKTVVWSSVASVAIKDGTAVSEFDMDLSSYTPGNYVLTLSSNDGIELSQKLFVEDGRSNR